MKKEDLKDQRDRTDMRECGMMCITGIQGVGKTYQNMHSIKNYVRDKFYNKVSGRKVLIFDTNGEYTETEFAKADVDIEMKKMKVRDVGDFGRSNLSEIRRIDASLASIDQKLAAVQYILKEYRNGMFVLEDINTYLLNVSHMKDIVGGLVNLRHRGVDVLVSYQSARAVEPRIWQNSRWVRMHYQADNVNDIKGKLPNLELYKLAQILVNNRYFNGDKRFFVFVHNFSNKIEGKFDEEEFLIAAHQYLQVNKSKVKEHSAMYSVPESEALEHCKQTLLTQYYGN
jgi:hypothetical protein